jgi:hypothetical protein
VKAGGKQSHRLVEIWVYIRNRKEIKDSNSVAVGSPVGRNESPVPVGSHTQTGEPTADKNRITSLALKRACFDGLGKAGELVGVWWAGN